MDIHETGVLERSLRYIFTPSSFAERMFYYPTRIGHYFCDRKYCFSYQNEIAMQPGHQCNYMLFLLKQGQMDIKTEGQNDIASSRQIVFFDCQQAYEYHALTDDLEFFWLLFHGGQSMLFYQQLLETHGRHVFRAGDAIQLQLLFTRLLTYGEMSERVPERTYSEAIYAILCQLLAPAEQGEDNFAAIISEAAAFMDRQYDTTHTVEEVAAHVGLSASYFTKVFHAWTGYSPYEYLTLQRIHRAKELLISTHLTVKQIAYETGYRSADNFMRSFKAKVGVSPTMYRKFPV